MAVLHESVHYVAHRRRSLSGRVNHMAQLTTRPRENLVYLQDL